MKYTLEIPDQKQEFIRELLQAFSYVKLTPETKPAKEAKVCSFFKCGLPCTISIK